MADTRPRRRRKHSRARTGCLTCRKRRIKCDERKPICSRCQIGARECTYPSMLDPIRLSSVHDPFRTSSELRPPSSGSESSLGDHDEQSDDVVIFKPSTDSEMDPRWPTDRLSFFESLFPLAPETPPLYCHNPPSPDLSLVPRSPKPNEAQAIRFFLTYHERVVVPAHYFKWYDFHHFCKGWLLAMAEQSDPLRYAMVSFSALIYSMKVNLGARYTAFYYYAAALKELRLLLDNESMNLMECNIAIATALQLATIDRFFGDAAKCFRHLEGVAHILQNCSTPLRQSATMLGRSLLEWYWNFEDYTCLLFARKHLLPRIWRYENVRERQRLAESEYHRLAPNERKGRILDDLWPQLSALYPQLVDVFVGIPAFKALHGSQRSQAVARLSQQIRQFDQELQEFMYSPLVEEVLEEAGYPVTFDSHHSECCPPVPFIPYIFQFPPAGFLRLLLYSVQTYLHSIVYPLLRAETGQSLATSELLERDQEMAAAAAYEQCRSFAGLEAAFGFNQDLLFPCLSPLPIAGKSCAPEIRMWLWYKLAHFEELGHFSLEPITKVLSVWWDMPNLAEEGFGPWKVGPPAQQVRVLSVEDVDLATQMGNLEIEDRITEGRNPEEDVF